MGKVEEAIQEHAKKIQLMDEEISKIKTGETSERITRRRKSMESDLGERYKEQWSPSFITLNGWVDWDREMETMMDSADARKILKDILQNLPAHRREIIVEGVTFSDLGERVLHMKIVIKIKKETEERDVWQVRNRILDMHRTGQSGWPEKLKVQVDVNLKKKPYVTEMEKLLRWLKRMEVHEEI